MCVVCWTAAIVGGTAVVLDRKYNDSKVTNCIKKKVFKNKNNR